MNDINVNIFANKNEIFKSEFEEIVKQNDLEVFTEKGLSNYLKTIKSGLKENEELQTTTEFQHIHPITVVTEKGLKGRVFYRSIYDLEKSEVVGTEFEKAGLPEGTERDWKGGKFKKEGNKWVPVKKEKEEKKKEEKPALTVKQFNRYFGSNYGHIQHNLPDKKVEKFINEYKDKPIEKIADLFSDYLLSQGLADVQP